MVAPSFRTRKKVFRKSLKGRKIVLYKEDKPRKKKCALCGSMLHGVPNKIPSELRKLPKTKKRPERIFGGVLCGNCVQQITKEKTRLKTGVLKKEQVLIKHLKYFS